MDELLILAKNGDEAAIEQLVSDYKGMIRSLANRFYLVGGDKDDLLQEGMLGFIYAINKYDEDKGAFPAFAELCVLRQILGAVKRDNRVGQKPLYNYVDLETVTEVADLKDSPLEILLHKEIYQRIVRAVDTELTPVERQVIKLFADGYSYDIIAEKLGRSHKSVDGALQRARKKLLEHVD